jgi:hypothetical protein
LVDQIKEDKVGWAWSMHGRGEKCAEFAYENKKEKEKLHGQDVDQRII